MIATAKFEDSCWPLHVNRDKKFKTHFWYKMSCWCIFCEIDNIDKSKLFKSLLGYHCFTGCDSISAFCGKGKIKALSIFCKDKSFTQAFYNLGQTNELSEETIFSLEHFVCHLYGKSSDSENQADINQLQIRNLLPVRNQSRNTSSMSKCSRQHMNKSNYQTYIWQKSLKISYQKILQ